MVNEDFSLPTFWMKHITAVHVLIINSVPNMNLFGNLSYFSFSSKEIYTDLFFTFRSKTKGRVSETNLASIIPKASPRKFVAKP